MSPTKPEVHDIDGMNVEFDLATERRGLRLQTHIQIKSSCGCHDNNISNDGVIYLYVLDCHTTPHNMAKSYT